MKTTTVERGISNRSAGEKDLLALVNDEMVPLARQIRTALNTPYRAAFEGTSPGDGSWVNLWLSSEVEEDRGWLVEVHIIGVSGAGTASYIRRATFRDVGGTLAQVGATVAVYTEETAGACDVRFVVLGAQVMLDVCDDGAAASWEWIASVEVLEIALD